MAAFILFSEQELIYLAQWCRMAATLSRQYGAAESSIATKEIYEQSAQSCEAMAARFDECRLSRPRIPE